MGLRVDDEEVRDLIPLIRRATASTLYGVPAAAVYLLLVPLGVWLFDDLWTAGRIFFALAACVHALIFLSCRWSVGIRRKIEFQETRGVREATDLLVIPAPHCGSPAICGVHVDTEGESFKAWFEFHKVKYMCDGPLDADKDVVFRRLDFPIAEPLAAYAGSRGLSGGQHASRTARYGTNVLEIPMPTYSSLFKEHAVAPFFVFQVFTVLLWCLDEYWYFSLFTLFMMLIFEFTVIQQRIRSMGMLRAMRRPPTSVHVYRDSRWQEVSSRELAPGDIVSVGALKVKPAPEDRKEAEAAQQSSQAITQRQQAAQQPNVASLRKRRSAGAAQVAKAEAERARQEQEERRRKAEEFARMGFWDKVKYQQEQVLEKQKAAQRKQALSSLADMSGVAPCDLLLLGGSCVVNEALLTGESVPLRKEGLVTALADQGEAQEAGADADAGTDREHLAFEGDGGTKHRRHVVFAGTQVLQHAGKAAVTGIPKPPDGGCPAYVLRTGFYTAQGNLMRTFLYASERVTGNNVETFLFILFLLVFAIAASAYVLHHGLQDESRSRWKLALHCIMIITSVVPPELPMELSLAVNSSLMALIKKSIFCTEPFRIPVAGKVDVCCFDKTGTLTQDKLQVAGVLAPASAEGGAPQLEDSPVTLPPETAWVLGACHELVSVSGKAEGDPLEQAALAWSGWQLVQDDEVAPGLRAVARARKTSVTAAAAGSAMREASARAAARSVLAAGDGQASALDAPSTSALRDAAGLGLHIVRRLPFVAELKRMSVVVRVGHEGKEEVQSLPAVTRARRGAWVLCKGAPEAVEPLLARVPPGFRDSYLHYTREGCRVLALAARQLPADQDEAALRSQWTRADLERDLHFAGLLVLHSPLKRGTVRVVDQLLSSRHRVIMITGDNALTACAVAHDVGLLDPERDSHVMWDALPHTQAAVTPRPARGADASADGTAGKPAVACTVAAVGDSAAERASARPWGGAPDDALPDGGLCVTGGALRRLVDAHGGVSSPAALDVVRRLAERAAVWARVSPGQKELVVSALKRAGLTTLMCGDGTNDVGALKQAHVGVSIVNADRAAPTTTPGAGKSKPAKAHKAKSSKPLSAQDQLRETMEQMQEDEGDPIVRFGDASIASPFTSKTGSIKCCATIVRQGRCTLVTTLQMYRILALNCLVSAFMLSVLYLHGVKQGDQQMTISGFAIAGFFLCISRAQPLKKLAPQRPRSRIFSPHLIGSVVLQAAIHVGVMVATMFLCEPFIDPEDPAMEPDGDFKPNILNTCIFLTSTWLQVVTFATNYQGHPFMQSLRENKFLFRGIVGLLSALAVATLGLAPPLEELLELTPFPTELLRYQIFGLLVFDLVGAKAATMVADALL